MEIIWMLV